VEPALGIFTRFDPGQHDLTGQEFSEPPGLSRARGMTPRGKRDTLSAGDGSTQSLVDRRWRSKPPGSRELTMDRGCGAVALVAEAESGYAAVELLLGEGVRA
jgi:hypothetical protein